MMFSMDSTWLLLLFLIPAAIWIWALIDIFSHEFISFGVKLITLVLVFSTPLLGAIIYFIVKKSLVKPAKV